MKHKVEPECIARDPNTTRNCPYSLYCAVCDLDDEDEGEQATTTK